MSKLHVKGWMVLPIAALVLAALGGLSPGHTVVGYVEDKEV